MSIGIFGGFNVNAVRRACRGAEKTADAFLQTIFVAMQNVNSTITRLKIYRFFGIAFRRFLPEHGPKSDTESVEHGPESVKHFANLRGHAISLANEWNPSKKADFIPSCY